MSPWLEGLSAALVLLGAAKLLGFRERHFPWLFTGVAVTAAAAAFASSGARPAPAPRPVASGAPGFATSNACRSCHPAEHASWHESFHRRMTQAGSAQNSASPVLRGGGRLRVESAGRSVELFARGGELWARLPDPELTSAAGGAGYEAAFRAAPARDVRVQLLTGSHHQQAFWVGAARDGELRAVPAVYLIEEQRLIPRRDAFVNPPRAPEHAVRWNSNCIQCHAVAGAPRHDLARDAFDSSAAELGIACEACHAEAAEHVRAMQNPLARLRARDADEAPSVVNPRRLSSERASEVCGRCHSYFFPKDEAEWWLHGFSRSYRPGDVLAESQRLLSLEALAAPDAPRLDESAESLFYRDGTIRVAGREYNGLVQSPCFQRGDGERRLSCLSCHSMHRSRPDQQLAEGMRGNQACAECHARKVEDPSAHTRHAASSAGSLCYNCHMPHTTYALLGVARSHRIDSPAFDERSRDRPNACSLCHLEQSERWAARHAAAWFGDEPAFRLSRPPGLDDDAPAGAVFALAGDAAVRAVTAAALGRAQSGGGAPALRRQLLRELSSDDYAAVRFIAEQALAKLPASRENPPLPAELVARLRSLRDDRPVTIAE